MRNGLEDGGFPRRLVSDDNDLGKIDDLADMECAKIVNGVKKLLGFGIIELIESSRVQRAVGLHGAMREGHI